MLSCVTVFSLSLLLSLKSNLDLKSNISNLLLVDVFLCFWGVKWYFWNIYLSCLLISQNDKNQTRSPQRRGQMPLTGAQRKPAAYLSLKSSLFKTQNIIDYKETFVFNLNIIYFLHWGHSTTTNVQQDTGSASGWMQVLFRQISGILWWKTKTSQMQTKLLIPVFS